MCNDCDKVKDPENEAQKMLDDQPTYDVYVEAVVGWYATVKAFNASEAESKALDSQMPDRPSHGDFYVSSIVRRKGA